MPTFVLPTHIRLVNKEVLTHSYYKRATSPLLEGDCQQAVMLARVCMSQCNLGDPQIHITVQNVYWSKQLQCPTTMDTFHDITYLNENGSVQFEKTVASAGLLAWDDAVGAYCLDNHPTHRWFVLNKAI